MPGELICAVLLFFFLSLGLGWPVAASLRLSPPERLLAATVSSLIILWLGGWMIYIAGWPWRTLWLLPALAGAGLWRRRRILRETFHDPTVRAIAIGQMLVGGWCLAWLALVQSYSGGGWSGDWLEHWQRARFFLDRSPLETTFLDHYLLPARPPMANVVTAGLLTLTRADFAHYQVFSTLSSSLAFLPAALLSLRWQAGRRTVAAIALILLLNPLFVQNATFAWTKLPAAMFVLSALYFFLRRDEEGRPVVPAVLFSVSIAAALLVHYSAAPYALLLAGAWFVRWTPAPRADSFRSATMIAATAGIVLLLTWGAWAAANYGLAGVALSNTSVTAVDPTAGGQAQRILLNLRDTLVPHFLRPLDTGLIVQSSPWGFVRDWFFQNYQLNLLFAFGSTGWLVILRAGRIGWTAALPGSRRFWLFLATGAVLLGVGAHGARDTWGLTHICLQPLVILGLVFLAARWRELSPGWRRLFIAGATVDLMCGIALHFAVQNFAFDRWFTPARSAMEVMSSYNLMTLPNALTLGRNHLVTLNEMLALPPALVLALLGAILIVALHRTRAP